MRDGLMKIIILKIISTNKGISGYGIIKKIEEITGRRPSTGTVYPILQYLCDMGWVEKREASRGMRYYITPSGVEQLNEFRKLKEEYIHRILERMSMAGESFSCDDMPEDGFMLMLPLVIRVRYHLQQGREKDVRVILEEAIKKLDELGD